VAVYPGNIIIVGMGRSGTTLLREILHRAFGSKRVEYYHWPRNYSIHRGSGKKHEKDFWIICQRDFRDVLASGIRNMIQRSPHVDAMEEYRVTENQIPPEGFKKFRVDYHYKEEYYNYEYFIPEHQILKQGHKIIEDGWDYWIDRVDYIFCYEDYMKDRNKVVTDLMNKIPFNKVYDYPVDDLIGQTDVWLGVNPEHASNGGKINGWSDVFSEKQEQIIIREFGGWLKSQGYIKE
tara:strand:+ start:1020 stop:1724 length:705 start_codon:yes stop_codon:yes gene_type:complete